MRVSLCPAPPHLTQPRHERERRTHTKLLQPQRRPLPAWVWSCPWAQGPPTKDVTAAADPPSS